MRALLLAAALCSGCSSLGDLELARLQARQGQPDTALQTLADSPSSQRERLLFAMETGAIAHQAGRLEASVQALLEASRILDEQDRISLKDQSLALVLNDSATSYRGEYAERLWVHTLQMMNFLLLDNPEAAAVEARQALQQLERHDQVLAADTFSHALIALSFEAMGRFDSANIEYQKLFDTADNAAPLALAAARNARRAGRPEAAIRFEQQAGQTDTAARSKVENAGELILFLSAGDIPRKASGDLLVSLQMRIAFPYYPATTYAPLEYRLLSQTGPVSTATGSTTPPWHPVAQTQLVALASASLQARGKALAARQIVRTGTRYAMAQAAGDEFGEGAEALVNLLFFALEQADTRSWASLPATWGLARIDLPAGRHDLELELRQGARRSLVTLTGVDINRRRPTFRALTLPPDGTALALRVAPAPEAAEAIASP